MTTSRNLRRGVGPLVVLVVALSGCGGGDGDQAGAPAEGTGIVIRNFTYSPIPAQVSLGQSVMATNEDTAGHTLTVPGGVDSGNLAQGEPFTFTPAGPGTLNYLCDVHQDTKGEVVVR